MEIPKAIKTLDTFEKGEEAVETADLHAAIKLGSEALKYRLQLEQEDPEITLEPLPGETED